MIIKKRKILCRFEKSDLIKIIAPDTVKLILVETVRKILLIAHTEFRGTAGIAVI